MNKKVKYVLHILEGEDGKLSGKRVLGTILVLSGVAMSWYGVMHRIEHLDSITGMVLAILGAGLGFWGITTLASVKNAAMNSTDTTTITDAPPENVIEKTISTDKPVEK